MREIFSTYGSIEDMDMPMNRQCEQAPLMVKPFARGPCANKLQSIPTGALPTSSTQLKSTPKMPLRTCMKGRLMAPLSTSPLYSNVASSPLHHRRPDADRTTILDLRSTVLSRRDHDVARLCAAMVDLILAATSTLIVHVQCRVLDLLRSTERAQGHSLHGLDRLHREDGM